MNRKFSKWHLLCAAVMVLSGCISMTHNYGGFVPDDTVTKQFEAYQMEPDMNYYFSGSESYPNAIMGLKKRFMLDNDLWQPIKPDPQYFSKLIYGMRYKSRETGAFQHGFIMQSPGGEPIGVWYSGLTTKMRVRMGKDNKVVVYTPDMGIYDREGRSRMDIIQRHRLMMTD